MGEQQVETPQGNLDQMNSPELSVNESNADESNADEPRLIQVRAAQVQDVAQMHALMLPFMQENILIKRDLDDLYQHIQEFMVAICEGQVMGVAALHIYASNLAEIRSLVVSPQAQGLGMGHKLVQACEKFAKEVGVSSVFALTYVDTFFTKQGYAVVSKESLPEKVWTVCVHCPKFSFCDEIAVKKDLDSAVA